MAADLERLRIKGFKTIQDADLAFRPLNVLIGANGAGKSNLISFFRLLSWSLTSPGQLQEYIGRSGGASALLHDGPAKTPRIQASICLRTQQGTNDYEFALAHAAADTLIYTSERYRFSRLSDSPPAVAPWIELGAGHREALLVDRAERGEMTARVIHSLLRKCIVYQFHNTAQTARMRNKWRSEDGRWLKEDAANLAPFLWRLRAEEAPYYHRIVETIRQLLPFFADFVLEPDASEHLLLSWRERGGDVVFNASQAADGMLRAMALTTLLLQPEEDLPEVLILDEPELGLHPYAIDVLAGLLHAASQHSQIILATQSPLLIDYFDPQDVIVVEREDRASVFRRLEQEKWASWLEDYSLSELWQKNAIGGRPTH